MKINPLNEIPGPAPAANLKCKCCLCNIEIAAYEKDTMIVSCGEAHIVFHMHELPFFVTKKQYISEGKFLKKDIELNEKDFSDFKTAFDVFSEAKQKEEKEVFSLALLDILLMSLHGKNLQTLEQEVNTAKEPVANNKVVNLEPDERAGERSKIIIYDAQGSVSYM